MKRVFSGVLILGLGVTPVISGFATLEPGWGQTQSPQVGDLQRLLDQATQQTQQGKPQEAIETWQQLLKLARQLKNVVAEATALVWIGFNLDSIGRHNQALDYYNQALPIVRRLGDRQAEARTLNNIGESHRKIGQSDAALQFLNQALVITQQVKDRRGEAVILDNIGGVYRGSGQLQFALKYYNQALLIGHSIGDQEVEATTRNNLGLVYSTTGNSKEALKYYSQALSIRQQIGDRKGEAETLSNIGLVYRTIGQLQEALKYYSQSLSIEELIGNREGEATTLTNIGVVYLIIGEPQKALTFFGKALPLRKEIGDLEGEARTLSDIALLYQYVDKPSEEAKRRTLEALDRVLSIQRTLGDREGEGTTLNNIGMFYGSIGQTQNMLNYLNQSLTIRQEIGDRNGEAATLNNIGFVFTLTGQSLEALKYYSQALTIERTVEDREAESVTLSNIGASYREVNFLPEAISSFEKSVMLALKLRQSLLRENRSTFLQKRQDRVAALVSLLIDTKQLKQAYEWTNLATTADLVDYARLINAKVANPQAQAALDVWNQQNYQLRQLRQQLHEKFSSDLAEKVRDQEAQLNQQAETIARQFPEVAELLETTPNDIAQLRASIPVGVTILHPALLTNVKNVPDTIALFILTRDTLTVQKIPINPKQFELLLSQTYTQLTNRLDDRYLEELAKLYDLLIRPIEAQIQATNPKQLSIVATGKLRYLPFEALYDSKTNQYLIQKYPVSYLTRLSISSLKSPSQNVSTSIQSRKLLVLGNPVPKEPLSLPGAEQEVKQILPIFPESESLIGQAATLDAFKLQSLRFSLLHLATHGCFQKGGCPKLGLEENTLLFADQRFNIADAALLGLQNVDLITLSACQTALETNSNGEEIAGLAYLFERAGAKATISSLWSAEDKTTQAIMVQFYKNLKQGMSKGEALQKAKLTQINSHPFFWAPFVLIGDAR